MKNQISFITGLFESGSLDGSEAERNALGGDLAKWFVRKCSGDDEFRFGEPVPGEVGWVVSVEAENQRFILDCGIVPATMGAAHADWTIAIRNEKGWNPFGSKDSPLRGRLCDLIHNVLRDEGETREVRWRD